MGRVKLNTQAPSYPERTREQPEAALERALEEVRAERRFRDKLLLRLPRPRARAA